MSDDRHRRTPKDHSLLEREEREELGEKLSAMMDGELDAESEAELRGRLASDPQLAARLAELESVGAALVAMPIPVPSAELREALRSQIEADELRPLPVRRARMAWAGAAFAAAASLAAWLIVSGSGSQPLVPGLPEAEQLAAEFSGATDEEIGIALDYETLADLEVIEDLEILEFMIELEDASKG
jgi:anti-sigma factor RsiW